MQSTEFLGLPPKNHHFFYFPDAGGQKYVKHGIEKVMPLIKDADRIMFPSDNNKHEDHQATHDIAIGAAKNLELKDLEYFIYFIPSYGKFQDDSKSNQFEYTFDEERAKELDNWLNIYQSQANLKWTWKMYKWFVKNVRNVTYGIYTYDEIGQYYNF
jgi:LmbE family N-acetylglucosaminyl deacetylase